MAVTTVVTLVRDRTEHLHNLVRGLDATTSADVALVVVQMGGADPSPAWSTTAREVRHLHVGGTRLPLARARNLAATTADDGPVVFLDVDCIPGPGLVATSAAALDTVDGVVMGGVSYLDAGADVDPTDAASLDAHGQAHPARPLPPPGLHPCTTPELFWSLSFALRRTTFLDTIGGFDPAFRGYGGEDTDFARSAVASGVPLYWLGDAVAHHQHHASFDPPLQHVADVVANATTFHAKWGDWCMEGWLAAYRDRGLVDWAPDRGHLRLRRLPTDDEVSTARRDGVTAP